MTMARSQLVDVSITRWYHCISRCVRRAFLLSEAPIDDSDTRFDRKEWIELRLKELADIFAVAVGGFSVMDNYLNPVAAGIVEVPEASPYTSITTRVENVEEQGRTTDLKAAEHGSLAGSNASAGVEESLWLCPIEDRRNVDSSREGMLEGFALGSYLLLVDFTGRLFRDGKAVISAELTGIFNRLGTTAETWQARLERLKSGRLLGRFFAASRTRLREVAAHMKVHHLANLGGCPAP
jgi:hypothetical protein